MCVLAGVAGSHSYSVSYKLIPRVTAMKLLHIDSSVLGPHSVSRQVSAAIVDRPAHAPPGRALRAVGVEFLSADIVVIGAPMYNFTIPSQLKAWIDRIVVAGKTFKYSDKGAEGLAGAKRVIIAVSRGNFYGAGAPAAAGEHLETYLRWVFGFIGIAN